VDDKDAESWAAMQLSYVTRQSSSVQGNQEAAEGGHQFLQAGEVRVCLWA